MVHEDIVLLQASTLFDAGWYLQQYPDVADLGMDPVEHYVRLGASLGRDPGPCFSTREYHRRYPDVAESGCNPLVHYLTVGQVEQRVCMAERKKDHESAAVADSRPTPADIRRAMDILRKSPLFDADYYRATYPDVAKHGMDPLLHYVKFGAAEGRKPNPWFSTRQYRARYVAPDDPVNPLVHYLSSPESASARTSGQFDGRFYMALYEDVADSGLTPLEHFLVRGLAQGRQTAFAGLATAAADHIVDCRRIRVTVVLPVHDARDEVEACIQSVLRHTPLGRMNRLLIVDDASTDPAIGQLLDHCAGLQGVSIARNEDNLGYTRTVNHGIDWAGTDDVVLLNSDTEVGPHWLRNLKVAAYRDDHTGTVTAVSNNAGMFSVPQAGTNELPQGFDVEAMVRAVSGSRLGAPFEVPTGNGFCLYIKRGLINDIGLFDAQAFPVGYGEENEWCMRGLDAGWCHRVDPSTYVAHVRSASFGPRRRELAEIGLERVRKAFPEYDGAVRGMRYSVDFEAARYAIARNLETWAARGKTPKPRIMYVISTRVGGTPQTNADLMHALSGHFDCYALACDRYTVEVLQAHRTDYKVLQHYDLREPVRFATHVSAAYDEVVRSILLEWAVELLHVRHLAWHSLHLVDIAKSLDIPVVHSFHDFYTVCPSVTLVGQDGHYQPQGVVEQPRNPLWRNDPTDTGLNEAWLRRWQQRMQQVLSGCDAFITTCESARAIVGRALPLLQERQEDFHVIPHGRDFEQFVQYAERSNPGPEQPLRILLPGNIGLQKGMNLILRVKELDPEGRFEFHLLGKCDPHLNGAVTDHGPYQRSEFAQRVAGIRPHLAVVVSIWPETWCHTLTECWSCGIPVLGLDLGAVGERIRRHGAGWLVPADASGDDVHAKLSRLRTETGAQGRQRQLEEVIKWQEGPGRHQDTERMAAAYRSAYHPLLQGNALPSARGHVSPR